MKTLVIAGTHSGSGKTTITLGLMTALKRRGLSVAPFKVGPDFIDPGHHRQAAGVQSRNLDGWMLSKQFNLENFARHSIDADIALIEGVMGLFDGYDGRSEAGSTAQMAKWLAAPVLLVVDARSMARSVAALVQGFETFDPDLVFAGVIFNRVGSPRHLTYLTDALAGHVGMPCLGGVTRAQEISIPERHLGLVTQEDFRFDDVFLNQLADILEKNVNLDRLLDSIPERSPQGAASDIRLPEPATVSIAVARDSAFCFYYPENLELLEKNGAEIKFFSPISAARLPRDVHGIYFGGGYPELFAPQLAANTALRREIKAMSEDGMSIYGECGGLMYLGESICDPAGDAHPMTGCLPFTTRMLPRLKRLGYREITLAQESLLGPADRMIRGHEFHYSEIVDNERPVSTCYAVTDRAGKGHHQEGYQINRTLGSYIHLHWGSCPEAAASMVNACRQYKKEKHCAS